MVIDLVQNIDGTATVSNKHFELIFAVSNPSDLAKGLALSIFNGVVRSLQ